MIDLSRPRAFAILLLLAMAFSNRAGAQAVPSRPLADYRRAVLAGAGDAGRGLRLFEDAARTRCLACHPVGGKGGMIGPDLAGLGGGRVSRAEILDSILEPSAKIHPDYAPTVVALKSGQVHQGIVRPVDDATIEVLTSDARAVRVARVEIEEQTVGKLSTMPEGLHLALSPGEMADLLAYLVTVEPPSSGSPREATDPRAIPRASTPVVFPTAIDPAMPLDRPAWFGPLPGDPATWVVAEMQRARILLIGAEDGERTVFADLGDQTTPGELTGLTSIAFHPDFARNRRYFLKMHAARGEVPPAVQILERKAAADGRADSGEPSRLILKIPATTVVHNGGNIAFGPDGYLYVGMGDTGPQGDPRGHGQDPGTLLGKLSRIDVDHADGDQPYSIPADNPFRDRPDTRPEIWALGFREPWRFSFDRETGDLWVGDVGQGLYEEVSIVRGGENHGWNVVEEFRPFSDRHARKDARYTPPVFAYHHRVGLSVTGGYVYRGPKNPALVGKYVFGDYETRRVWALEHRDRALTSLVEIGRAPERIASFGLDAEGEIYLIGQDRGLIYRLDASAADLTPATPPREVVPTARRGVIGWRHVLKEPSATWTREDFDDASWAEAPGGFGTRGTPGAEVRTEWRTRDIWLRRPITLPEGDPKRLSLTVHHDEDAEIYLNGVLAASLPGFTGDYDEVPIRAEALAAVRPGTNLLAVHCRQTGGGQYIDVGITESSRPPASR